jgi:hypothetical protein
MCCDIGSNELDAADDFVARHDWIFDVGKLRIDHMKVGSANPASAHLHANFAIAGRGLGAFLHLQW